MSYRKIKIGEQEIEVSALSFWLVIFSAVILILAVVGWMAFYTLESGEQGIILRAGRLHKIEQAGWHWRLPLGIDKLTKVKTAYNYSAEFGFRTNPVDSSGMHQTVVFPAEARMLTGDLCLVEIEWVVHYQITDPIAYLRSSPRNQTVFRLLTESAMRAAVGDYALSEVFQTERQKITQRALADLQNKCALYNLGFGIRLIQIRAVRPVVQEESASTPVKIPVSMPPDSTHAQPDTTVGNR